MAPANTYVHTKTPSRACAIGGRCISYFGLYQTESGTLCISLHDATVSIDSNAELDRHVDELALSPGPFSEPNVGESSTSTSSTGCRPFVCHRARKSDTKPPWIFLRLLMGNGGITSINSRPRGAIHFFATVLGNPGLLPRGSFFVSSWKMMGLVVCIFNKDDIQ
jgi:hypothetical protein